MFRYVWLILFSLFLLPSKLWAQTTSADAEFLTRLPNGLTVYLIPDRRFPLVATRLYVFTGSANEKPAEAGISHVLEHMVFKGTELRPKGKVAQEVESLGGYLNAATSFDRTWYITDIPSAHWKTGIDVVKDMAFGATLDAAELEPEKNVIVSELQGGEDQPMHKLFEELVCGALANSPYGRPIIGYESTIRAVSSESLRAYRDRWYQPQNMALLVAGDMDRDAVLSYIVDLFGSLKNTRELEAAKTVDLAAAPGGEKVRVRRGPWKKVYLGLSFPAPEARDLRSVDLDVLSYLLGGDETSYLYRRYKYELELVDSISCDNMSLARAGMLSITASLDQDKVVPFFSTLIRDLAQFDVSIFSREELARAVLNIEDSQDRADETLTGLASRKSSVQFVLGGAQQEKNQRLRLKDVNKDILARTAKAWLRPDRLRLRVLAPDGAALPDFSAELSKTWPESLSASDQKDQYDRGGREEIALDNGCSLILLPDTHAPYLSLNLTRMGGNALIGEKEQGLPTLVARLLSDGCGERDRSALETYLSARALSLSVSSGRQSFSVHMDGPSRFSSDLFTILTELVTKPRFEQKELEREVRSMLSAIRAREDQPMRYLFARIRPFLYPHHVYGFDDLGGADLLARFDLNAVRAFWKKQSVKPFVLSIAGSFNKDEVLAFARTLSAGCHPEKTEVAVPKQGTERSLKLTLPSRSQAHLLKIFPTVPTNHPDVPALTTIARILSGQSGLLFSSMRDEKGLGYTVTAFSRTLPEAGSFFFYIGTVPDKIKKADEGFDMVIRRLTEQELPLEELKAAVNQMRGEQVRSKQSLEARADEAASNALLGYPLDFQLALIEKAARLTPADILACAKKYFSKDAARTVTLMP